VKIKNGDPIKNDQISALVTHLIEKCNFYKDLEGVMDWEESKKTTDKEGESE
jgi:hypothetical protein